MKFTGTLKNIHEYLKPKRLVNDIQYYMISPIDALTNRLKQEKCVKAGWVINFSETSSKGKLDNMY